MFHFKPRAFFDIDGSGPRAREGRPLDRRVRADRAEQARAPSCSCSARSCSWAPSGTRSVSYWGTGPAGLVFAAVTRDRPVARVVLRRRQGRAGVRARARRSRPSRSRGCTTSWRGSRSRPACRSRASTSSPSRRRTRSPPAATPSTRRSPSRRGCWTSMNRVELEGVIGHELSHVVDRDILRRHRRRHAGRRGRADVGVLPAVVVVGRVRRAPGQRPNGGGRRAHHVRGRLRAAGPRADRAARSSSSPSRATASTWPTRRARCSRATRRGWSRRSKKIEAAPHAMRAANNATAHLWLDQPSRVQASGRARWRSCSPRTRRSPSGSAVWRRCDDPTEFGRGR